MDSQLPTILVTGAAGFIGAAAAEALMARGQPVIGIDSMNDYYAVSLKRRVGTVSALASAISSRS